MRFAWLVLLVAGCGSDLSRDQACTDLATARCGQLSTCSPADLTKRWPDASTCEAREKLACMDALAAPQTAATPTSDKACADALTRRDLRCVPDHRRAARGLPAAARAARQWRRVCVRCRVCERLLLGRRRRAVRHVRRCARRRCLVRDHRLRPDDDVREDDDDLPGAGHARTAACSKDTAVRRAGSRASRDHELGTCQAEVATAGSACDPKRMTGPDCDAVRWPDVRHAKPAVRDAADRRRGSAVRPHRHDADRVLRRRDLLDPAGRDDGHVHRARARRWRLQQRRGSVLRDAGEMRERRLCAARLDDVLVIA